MIPAAAPSRRRADPTVARPFAGRLRAIAAGLAVVAGAFATPAAAALTPGAAAPPFRIDAALAGSDFRFDLAEALKKGPVVLYFYPKAFTKGCTIEAHEFAEATPRFASMHATVIGVSHDDIDSVRRFSREGCRDRFAVGSDGDGRVIGAYDATMASNPAMADRISYVIAPDGRIASVLTASDPRAHIEHTLKAVEALERTPAR